MIFEITLHQIPRDQIEAASANPLNIINRVGTCNLHTMLNTETGERFSIASTGGVARNVREGFERLRNMRTHPRRVVHWHEISRVVETEEDEQADERFAPQFSIRGWAGQGRMSRMQLSSSDPLRHTPREPTPVELSQGSVPEPRQNDAARLIQEFGNRAAPLYSGDAFDEVTTTGMETTQMAAYFREATERIQEAQRTRSERGNPWYRVETRTTRS